MKSGPCSSLFLAPLRTLLLPERPVYMVISTGIWSRFNNNLCSCLSQSLSSMRSGKAKTDSGLMFKGSLLQILVLHLLQRSLTLELSNGSHQDGRKSSGHRYGSSADSRKEGGCGGSVSDVLQSFTSSIPSLLVCRLVLFHNIWISGKP